MTEEEHYEAVANEISSTPKQAGLWAKALARCLGDERQAEDCYIKLRVEQRIEEEKLAFTTTTKKIKELKASIGRSWPAWLQVLFSLAFLVFASWYKASSRDGGFSVEFVIKGIVHLVVIAAVWLGCLWLLLKFRARTPKFPWGTFRIGLIILAALPAVVVLFYPANRSPESRAARAATPLPLTNNPVASTTPKPRSEFVPLDTTRPYPALSGLAAIKDLDVQELNDWISKQRVIVSELEQSVTARNKTLLDQRPTLKSKDEMEEFNEEVRVFESDRTRLLQEKKYLEQMEGKLKPTTP